MSGVGLDKGNDRLERFFASKSKMHENDGLNTSSSSDIEEQDSSMVFRSRCLLCCDEVRRRNAGFTSQSAEDSPIARGSESAQITTPQSSWSHCEGNADFLWSISSHALTAHLHSGILRPQLLKQFAKELKFRNKHAKECEGDKSTLPFEMLVERKLQGLVSLELDSRESWIFMAA